MNQIHQRGETGQGENVLYYPTCQPCAAGS